MPVPSRAVIPAPIHTVGALVKLVTPWFPVDETFTWLELDGNAQTVTRSRQPDYFPRANVCPHHGGPEGLGEFGFNVRHTCFERNRSDS